jgi:hypothetical protein
MPGEDHGQPLLVGGLDHFLVAHRAAGLNDRRGAGIGGGSKARRRTEEGVRGDDAADRRALRQLGGSPDSAARMAAMREESRRFICPRPTPTVAPSLA